MAQQHSMAFVKHHAGLKALIHNMVLPRTERTRFFQFLGPPGSGKSSFARKICTQHGFTMYTLSAGKWFDGYMGQDVVLIDEIDKNHALGLQGILYLADRYPYRVQVKGSTVEFNSKLIIATSNYPVHAWFTKKVGDVHKLLDSTDVEAIDRRTDLLVKFSKPND